MISAFGKAKRLPFAPAVIERDTDRDNFMTAEEAKAYGLIDEVMENSSSLS
jgi:ATP-dependent protease ClpP protease subunit